MSCVHKHIGTAADFCDNRDLKVTTVTGRDRAESTIPSTVTLNAGSGACYFQYSMTSAGARDLAELLLDAALQIDTIDALEGAQ